MREAPPDELADWDARTVDAPGGHVYQSRAWAEHRRASGWQPRFLVADDGGAVLALTRPWPLVRGGSAYVPRGPVALTGEVGPVALTGEVGPAALAGRVGAAALAGRLVQAAETLAVDGIDVVAADPEVPATDLAFGDAIVRAGFHPIEEIQPSRHRVSLPLGSGADEATVFDDIAKSTRQRIRAAERDGVTVTRHDARLGADGLGADGLGADGLGDGFVPPTDPVGVALDRFYDLLLETGERRQFSFGPRAGFVAWWTAAHAAGHLILLEARPADAPITDGPVAGLVLYRHGDRLSTVHSGDHAATRKAQPGALHLLRWRAIQLAIREGRAEMDLGGVDVAGARGEPQEGDPLYGLYQHKKAFGGRWLELTGAHERVFDARGYSLGRLAGRAARLVRR